jgi:hypothetical protein
MIWTPEHDDKLRSLWPTHSLSMIATAFNVSRSAAAGRVHRLKLQGKPKGRCANGNPAPKQRPAPKPKPAPKPVTPLNIGFFDLEPRHCRFIVRGEGHKALFCGHTSPEGLSYCSWHCSIVYTKPERKPVTKDKAQSWAFGKAA